ncbi:cyclodeaminase/cyclohydrolase family protein [Methylomonas paludis]|uniref:Cyclodeaminase/cyclohydrolase family protein n=1 Tax=Methylomonas paludis TaxID=1173101 RepID=A0A975R9Q7_9GAMM|nr:methenyltetrahydrofolate cyclohydrolase [Methylomonas paludis]QWF70489.1 cyclodeaminase/cyclohydrolase family protein [Methylomonas paludis]
MTEIKDLPVEIFLQQLAGKQATPGGGSAAALMGAQAAALVSMVCQLTIGKPKYAAVAEEMQVLLQQAETLQHSLTAMIKADVDVFDALMQCYSLPKATDAEKAERMSQIQAVLRQATQVPLDCARACAQAISLSHIAAEKGSLAVISDAGVAAMSGFAALKSAALNVYINAASLKDREFAEAKLAELAIILADKDQEVETIYQLVKNKL